MQATIQTKSLFLLPLIALGMAILPPPVAAVDAPTITGPVEVTDSTRRMGNGPNPETSIMVRIGDKLYVVFRHDVDSSTDDDTYVRRFTLGSSITADTGSDWPKLIDTESGSAQYAGGSAYDGYHSEPTIARDANGSLHVFTNSKAFAESCDNTSTLAPRRIIVTTPGGTPSASSVSALPSPTANVNDRLNLGVAYVTSMLDLSAVYDDRSGICHFVGQGNLLGYMLGLHHFKESGESRGYYRITVSGGTPAYNGPFNVVWAGKEPTFGTVIYNNGSSTPRKICSGNVFIKGDVVLGREPVGSRSLHLAWSIRNTFRSYDSTITGCTGTCSTYEDCDECDLSACMGTATFHQANYDVFYAKSTDNGDSWTNYSGALTPKTVIDSGTGAHKGKVIDWNQSECRVFSGDVCQNSERAWDIDANGNPIFVIMKRRGTSGYEILGHADVHPDSVNPQTTEYDLVMLRREGSNWAESNINTSLNWKNNRPKVRVDMNGGTWVFTVPPGSYGLYYYYLPKDGTTWEGPTRVFSDSTSNNTERFWSYADPYNPNYHYLAYALPLSGSPARHQLYVVRLQLTKKLLPPVWSAEPGYYFGFVDPGLSASTYQAFGSDPAPVVRFTTNGTTPTSSSPIYSGTEYEESVTIKAAVFKNSSCTSCSYVDYAASDVVTLEYTVE